MSGDSINQQLVYYGNSVKEHRQNVKDLLNLLPVNCSEGCQNYKEINNLYQNYNNSLQALYNTQFEVSKIVKLVQQYFYQASSLMLQIQRAYNTIIENNLDINDQLILEILDKQVVEVLQQYEKIDTNKNEIINQLDKSQAFETDNQILKITKRAFQIQQFELNKQENINNQKKIIELKQEIELLTIKKQLISSKQAALDECKEFVRKKKRDKQLLNFQNEVSLIEEDIQKKLQQLKKRQVGEMKELQEQIQYLGFTTSNHFNNFFSKLGSSIKLIESTQALLNFMIAYVEKTKLYIQQYQQQIEILKMNCQSSAIKKNEFYKSKMIEVINSHKNFQIYSQFQTHEIILNFIKISDFKLQTIIDADENLKKLTEDLIIYILDLDNIRRLTNSLVKTGQQKGKDRVFTIEEYTDKIFFKIFKFELDEVEYTDQKLKELNLIIQNLELIISIDESRENKDNLKMKKLLEEKENFENRIDQYKNNQENIYNIELDKQKNRLKKQYQKEYNHIERIITFLNSILLQLDQYLNQKQLYAVQESLQNICKDLQQINEQFQHFQLEI
ncbi:hypothetical protein ABPG74_010283 [Tetrahymena malaccensis]